MRFLYLQKLAFGGRVDFPWSEYEALVAFMRECEGQVVLSLNQHPDIEELFGEFAMVAVDYEYTMAGGDRLSKGRELVIGTWLDGVPEKLAQSTLF